MRASSVIVVFYRQQLIARSCRAPVAREQSLLVHDAKEGLNNSLGGRGDDS